MTSPPIAVYCRVSSSKQAEHNSVSAQRHALESWLKAKGAAPESCLWFIDEATTGGNMNRPAWKAMVDLIHQGKVAHVVAFDLTRIGRSVRDVAGFIEDMIQRDVRVELVNGGFDLSTIWGKALAQMCAVFAELDLAFKKEQARAGIQAYIARNGTWGNPGRISKDAWRDAAQRIHSGLSKPADEVRRLGVESSYGYRRLKAERKRLTAV